MCKDASAIFRQKISIWAAADRAIGQAIMHHAIENAIDHHRDWAATATAPDHHHEDQTTLKPTHIARLEAGVEVHHAETTTDCR